MKEIQLEVCLLYSLVNRAEITLTELFGLIKQLNKKINNIYVDTSKEAVHAAIDNNPGAFKVITFCDILESIEKGNETTLIRKTGSRFYLFHEHFLDLCYKNLFTTDELEILKETFTNVNKQKGDNVMPAKKNPTTAGTAKSKESTEIESLLIDAKKLFPNQTSFDSFIASATVVSLKLKVAEYLANKYNVSISAILNMLNNEY